jgi:ankyrin repeat protein
MHRISLLLVPLLALSCSGIPSNPLARASGAGDLTEVRRQLAAGANPNAPVSGFEITPLGLAARIGRTDIAGVLLDAGASSEMVSGVNDWTPLVHAVHRGQEEMVRFLLSRTHPSQEVLDEALTMAAGYGMPGLVRELLAAGAPGGADALVGAVGGAWDIDAEWNGCETHTETVRALIDATPGLRVPDTFAGRSALRFAKKKGCTEMLALLQGEVRAAR